MTKIRVFFSKTDAAKYLSHLDLQTLVIRALRQAKIPATTTNGFNSRTYIAFDLPLSVGVEGLKESFIIKLPNEFDSVQIKDLMNNGGVLPSQIRILSAKIAEKPATEIKSAKYFIQGEFSLMTEFLKQENILVQKFSKKSGIKNIDLAPLIENVKTIDGGIYVTLPAGQDMTVSVTLFIKAYNDFLKASSSTENEHLPLAARELIFTKDKEIFS